MNDAELREIKDRLAKTTPGFFSVSSVGCKNHLLWVGGDWPESDDHANSEFIAHAKRDITKLIAEIEKLKFKIKETP